MKIVTLTIAALAALMAPTAAQAQAAAQSAKPAPIPVTSAVQLCLIREQELVNINRTMSERNQASARETDQSRKTSIITSLNGLREALKETEASWDRMGCSQILYGPRRS